MDIKGILGIKDREYKKPSNTGKGDMDTASITFWTQKCMTTSESTRTNLEVVWDDEEKMYKGDQWSTSTNKRDRSQRENSYNPIDNFIFSTIQNQKCSMTASMPEPVFEGMNENDDTIAEQLNDVIPFIWEKNKFKAQWKKTILQGIKHGPLIGMVGYDDGWVGGVGADKWVGEITVQHVDKEEFYPDPAILDLETRLQECDFICIKKPKKLAFFVDTWGEAGEKVIPIADDGNEDTGDDPQQAEWQQTWHRGIPKMVSEEDKQMFLELANEAEANGLPYKAEEYRDKAKGILKGIHVAHTADSVMLDYVPYMFDDGLYPFAFKTMYGIKDEPFGMGEVRNMMSPQMLHNFADDIEVAAMNVEALGGGYYEVGAISDPQLDFIYRNRKKSGVYSEVNNLDKIQQRSGVRVPGNISAYKEHKQKMIDAISQNTAIQQGVSPGSNVPYATIQELGARADTRTKGKVEVLEDFLKDIVSLMVGRVGQFWTEERVYRISDDRRQADIEKQIVKTIKFIANAPAGTEPTMQMAMMIELLKQVKANNVQRTRTFGRGSLVQSWTRDQNIDETGNVVEMKEEFIPEFDVKIKIMDEKPTDRNYYTNLVMGLLGKAIGIKSFWKTITDGTLPPVDEILAELEQQKQQAEEAAMQQQQQMNQSAIPGR